ncbi:MAG: GNAT family N-acetyltransferase [Candidatus Aenigmarchaeota archaeon]|nr:GNAT family N-acetyltransferase [Candidatus Aenigmarchaeota archaeon]
MISRMTLADMDGAVELHIKNLPEGVSFLLGRRALKRMYEILLEDEKNFAFVYRHDSRMIGVAVSSEDISDIPKKCRRDSRFMLYAAWAVIRKPGILRQLLHSYPSEIKPEMLFLYVDSKNRGSGIGKKLVASTEKEFKRRGIRRYKITISANNKARTFYEKIGFKRSSASTSEARHPTQHEGERVVYVKTI